jgi:hypothetical protein
MIIDKHRNIGNSDNSNSSNLGNLYKYKHVQDIASNVWNIQHYLNTKPFVTTINSDNVEMYGYVHHISDNVVNVIFSIPVTGVCYCL